MGLLRMLGFSNYDASGAAAKGSMVGDVSFAEVEECVDISRCKMGVEFGLASGEVWSAKRRAFYCVPPDTLSVLRVNIQSDS